MRSKFRGVGVALITPFKENGSVDFDSLERLIDIWSASGIDYLVVNGTTSEASTLEIDEKTEILEFVIERNSSNLPIMFGIGANNTQYVLDLISSTNLSKVDALLTVSPYYNKPSQAGIIAHYTAIADASPVPVLAYNVPGRTGVNITAKTTLELANHPNIFGIKDASGDLNQAIEVLKDKPEDFMLISGDDMLTVPLISLGAEGVISVLANAYPQKMSTCVHAALNNDFKTASAELFGFAGLNDLLYQESNPVGIKEVLRQKRLCEGMVRLPLVPASKELQERITENIL